MFRVYVSETGDNIQKHHIKLEEHVSGDMLFKLASIICFLMRVGISRVSICAPHPAWSDPLSSLGYKLILKPIRLK